jgi:chloride channel protein, CIC family
MRAVRSSARERLGDFTTTPRVVVLSLAAVAIGAVSALVAWGLLRLIGVFTNLFFYQRWSAALVSPAGGHLGWLGVVPPVLGALIVGVLARFGSERIRGHGIPEAIEAILINGSRLEPRVALLKPLASAISIGSGGPFGAEGPIIMTGGAFGSLAAQFFNLSSAERRTLLVAGAAGGMSATFASPLAAILLSVELLLFEWKPRSFVPVALASVTAAVVRRPLLGFGPLFPTPPHPFPIGSDALLGCLLVGLTAGVLSLLLTQAVYAAEDAFGRLPIHWMWWPLLGGLVVGLGGVIFPRALGVGYDTIADFLGHDVSLTIIVGVLLVKSVIWAVALGSGTSGGVLAPLLMMGCALGALEAHILPDEGVGFWPLVCMGAVLGGTMRAPFTGIVFALELTHDFTMLLPLLPAVIVAHAFTVLTMRRSILTEKVARRGYHLSREYTVDPLEVVFVRDVMRTSVVAIPARITRADITAHLRAHGDGHAQRLYPAVDEERRLVGVVTRSAVERWIDVGADHQPLADILKRNPIVAHADEPLRAVAFRMAASGLTRFPVVEHGTFPRLLGMVALQDLLKGRALALDAEIRRERVLRLHTAVLRPAHGARRRPPAEAGHDR